MIISRQWGMPNRWTFLVKPIAELLDRYVGTGEGWLDPFSGRSTRAQYNNDLDPESPAQDHMPADIWLASRLFSGTYEGVLFDPPYSGRQVKECYQHLGREMKRDDSNGFFFGNMRRLAAPLIRPGGLAICCGWNSNGLGLKHGFELIEVLIVAHGGSHNDTIVTVERKS